MKKAILAVLLAALLSGVKSQVSLGTSLGYSSVKAPTIGSNLQIGIHSFIISGGFDACISKSVSKGDFWWSRLGVGFFISELNKLEFTAGAGTYRKSADNKDLNEGLALVNVQYVHQIAYRPEGAFFVSVTSTKKFTIVSGGLRFIFRKRERDGCPSTHVR